MPWYAIHDSQGRLTSVGTVVASPLPGGLTAVELAGQPADSEMWDATTRTFVARPAKVLVDRLTDLISHPDFADFQTAYAALNAANKTRVRNGMIQLLGRLRFRGQSAPRTLDGGV